MSVPSSFLKPKLVTIRTSTGSVFLGTSCSQDHYMAKKIFDAMSNNLLHIKYDILPSCDKNIK